MRSGMSTRKWRTSTRLVNDMDAIKIVKSNYVRGLLAKNEREDSRGMSDFRDLKIQTGLIPNAEGSAQVDLGGTRVLVGVKLDLGEPMEDTPDEGTMAMAAELLPLASPDYETGPPSPEAVELARVVDRGIRAGRCVDMASLKVAEGKAWNVFVDMSVLNFDGNLFDACTLAAMAALMNTKVPAYEDEKVIREKRIKELKIDNIVTSATFAKINGSLVLDPTGNEEAAADARLTIASDGENIRAMQKGLGGSFSIKEVEEMISTAFSKHAQLKKALESAR